MINANELRIGNWVMIESQITTVEHIMGDEDYFLPIPITPEILDKCGFERMPLTTVKRWFNKDHIFYLQLEKGKYFVYGYKFYPNGITSLHQLQNLYFALTGEELNYTP